ncbi:MAG: Gfo/Idh/MocA family oxidoreductase [Bacteroidota bacterium]
MDKLKIGVVGLGWVAQVYHLPVLKKMSDLEIVAICDHDKGKAKSVGEKFGVSKIYTDYEEMLISTELNAVDICTPTDLHKSMSIAALQAGLDVFVERPIARSYEEARDISEAVTKNKRNFMVGMNNRFRPDMMLLKSIIENGEIGNIFYAKAGWIKKLSSNNPWVTQKEKSGGGVFLDLGLTVLDTLLWSFNFPSVKRVSAVTYNHTTKSVEDSCIAFFETLNGATMMLETSWSFQAAADSFYCDIFGSKGSVQLSPLRINKFMGENFVSVTPTKMDTQQNLMKKSYENELRHFVNAARGLHLVTSTAQEAVQRMKVVEAVYKSAKIQKEVLLK